MSETPPPAGSDTRFLVAAMALMVVVTALLAGLWLSMRARAFRAERELSRLRPQLRKARDVTGLFERALKEGTVTMPVVDRESLPAEAVKLDGRDVKALKINARTGESMGFAPGDVIIVQPPAPATSAAPAGGG
jgi:hypothetical protein